SSPARAWTEASAASAAAVSSCVESGFEAQSATDAPPAVSVRTRLAVSAVTCSDAAILTPFSGFSRANRSRIWRTIGICASAQAMRPSPASASEGSAMSDLPLVAVMIALVRPFDRHADVGRLLLGQLGQLHTERAEVQPRHLLVEVLRQHVHLL